MKETSNYESCNFHKEVVCEKPLCMFFELNNPRAIFVRRTTKMAREMKTNKGRIQLKKKKQWSRENMKYRDLKEIYASHISKSGFERVFPLQQSCDWTILRDAIRITIFRTRRGLFDFDELKRNVNKYKNWQTPDKLTYVSLKNVSCV